MKKTSTLFKIFSVHLITLLFLSCGSYALAIPESSLPDWFDSSVKFDGPVELNAITSVSCEIRSLLFEISGEIECALPEGVKPLTPLIKTNFKIARGERASFKFPLHFNRESASPIEIKITFNFPGAEFIKFLSKKAKDPQNDELLKKVSRAAEKYELTHKLDYIVTKNEGFTDFSAGVYNDYSKNGFAVYDAGASVEIKTVCAEIKKYEEFITTVRKSPELKAYLSTEMDMVSSEDRYLKLLYTKAYFDFNNKEYGEAEKSFRYLLSYPLQAAKNVSTSEIYIDAENNLAVIEYLSGKKKEALERFKNLKNYCEKISNPKLRYVFYNMAQYNLNSKDFTAAADCYRNALAIKPNFTACVLGLKRIDDSKSKRAF